jgi:hypothetical protein
MLFSGFFVHFYDLLWPSAASALRLWIDEKDYDEFGPTLVHERCFWTPSDHEDFPSPEVDTTADHEDFWVLDLIQANSCWTPADYDLPSPEVDRLKVDTNWDCCETLAVWSSSFRVARSTTGGSGHGILWIHGPHPWIPFSEAGRAEKSLQSLQSLQVIRDMKHDETRVKNHKEIILIFKSWGVPFNARIPPRSYWLIIESWSFADNIRFLVTQSCGSHQTRPPGCPQYHSHHFSPHYIIYPFYIPWHLLFL